jgi:hypothetical protein
VNPYSKGKRIEVLRMDKLRGWEFYGEGENATPSWIFPKAFIITLIGVGLFGFFFS